MKTKCVDKIKFPIKEYLANDFAALSVQVGSTGTKGGNSKHGARCAVTITDESGTSDIRAKVIENKADPTRARIVEIIAGGDSEIRSLAKILRFAADELEASLKTNASTKEQIPATAKQINYANTLLKKMGLTLNTNTKLTCKDVSSIIGYAQTKKNKPSCFDDLVINS